MTTGASAIFAGATSRTGAGAKFWVSNAGNLYAESASIVGDSVINGTNIGNGGGNIVSNLRVGEGALASNTTGTYNLAIGDGAMRFSETSENNIVMGASALFDATYADNNIIIGRKAAADTRLSGTNYIFASNIAIGSEALHKTRSSYINIAIGSSALFNTSDGNGNIAIGYGSMQRNGLGSNNVSIGVESMAYSSNGQYNTAVGRIALLQSDGTFNVAIGDGALSNDVSGFANVAIGTLALGDLDDPNAKNNTALGAGAGSGLFTGSNNVFISYYSPATSYNTIYIGNGNNDLALKIDGSLNTFLYGDLQVDTNTLYVDSTNNRVGIGTVNPTVPLSVIGAASITGNTILGADVRIPNGFLGVGTANPNRALSVIGSASITGVTAFGADVDIFAGGNLTLTNGNLDVYNSSNTDYPFRVINGTSSATSTVRSRSIFQYQSAAATNLVRVAGDPYIMMRSTSTARIKEDLMPLSGSIAGVSTEKLSKEQTKINPYDVLLITPTEFRSTAIADERQRFLGFIAEDVSEKFNWAAGYDDDGSPSNVSDRAIVAALLEVVKRQQKQIEELSDKINALGDNNG
jgi:hypothetical protein